MEDLTREQVIAIIREQSEYPYNRMTQLNKCSAYYTDNGLNCHNYSSLSGYHVRVLRSYWTNVALYVSELNTVYCIGTWSNTTVQHQHKFAKLFGADRIVKYGADGLGRGWR